ncbi:MAG: hypothetical protein ACRDQA_08005, partial [Nocardioidaceae bacterium]
VEALEQLRPKATDERVVSADIITLSASATVGGTGKGQIKVLVQHLANGQVRVSVVEGVSGGAGVAIGAYGELDLGETEFGSGAMAGVTGLAGLQLGNSWEIPPDETDELLIGLYLQKNPAAKLAGEAGSKGLGLADFLTPDEISAFGHTVNLPVDEMHHVVQHYTDYEVPTPDRTRIDVTGSGDAYAKLGLPYGAASAGVEAQANVAIGAFRERDGDVGVRYHVDGNVSGETHLPIAKLTGGPGDTPSGSLNGGATVEVTFDENGEPKEIHTQAVYGTGEHQTMQSGTIDLDGKQMKDDAVAVVKALHNPTPENLANVKDIDLSDWANGAEYTRAELDLRGEDYGASGGASIPQTLKGVGGSLSVKHQHIDYDYGPDPS